MTRAIRDALISVVALIVLLGILALIDERVRVGVTEASPAGIWDRVTSERGQVASAGGRTYQLIVDHGKLVTFVVAGSVLVACMLRT